MGVLGGVDFRWPLPLAPSPSMGKGDTTVLDWEEKSDFFFVVGWLITMLDGIVIVKTV
jgi:hypothetical protein